ncbi:MAG: hypothetical protein ACTHWA_06850 [Arachnia sp.]
MAPLHFFIVSADHLHPGDHISVRQRFVWELDIPPSKMGRAVITIEASASRYSWQPEVT